MTMPMKIKYQHDQDLDYVSGFNAFALNTGIKKEKADAAILLCPKGAAAAGVFSQNSFRSSSLDDAQKKIKNTINVLAVFSGNANACTGPHGVKTNEILSGLVADKMHCSPKSVLLSYTGVVGREFPIPRMKGKLEEVLEELGGKHSKESLIRKDWEPMEFSRGILTTDTREKRIACEVQLGGTRKFRFSACAKGAGMIHPNMATMLAFITTDLKLSQIQCQKALSTAMAGTFNQITVDGDTSTNDSAFFLASGASGVKVGDGVTMEEVQEIVDTLTTYLAKEVARDGEGATKLISVTATGAASLLEARKASRSVASSLLFKTAVFGGDPNYGRILVALGNSGLGLRPEKTEVSFAKIPLFQKNKVQEKNIPKAAAYLKDNKNIEVNVDLGRGKFSATAWTCDISYDYVKINAEYTT